MFISVAKQQFIFSPDNQLYTIGNYLLIFVLSAYRTFLFSLCGVFRTNMADYQVFSWEESLASQKVRTDAIKTHHAAFFKSELDVNVHFECNLLLTPSCYII